MRWRNEPARPGSRPAFGKASGSARTVGTSTTGCVQKFQFRRAVAFLRLDSLISAVGTSWSLTLLILMFRFSIAPGHTCDGNIYTYI